MKKSQQYKNTLATFRVDLQNEIISLVRKHQDIEMAVEWQKDIAFAPGVDDQDEPQVIGEIIDGMTPMVVIEHYGEEVGRVVLEQLDTELLIQMVAGLEDSLEDVSK